MKRVIIFLLTLISIKFAAYSKILNSPYLQAMDTSSVYILLETDSKLDAIVNFGLSEKALNQSAKSSFIKNTERRAGGATFVHRILLSALKPNTTYYYKASQGGDESQEYSFTTFPNNNTDFSFAWASDLQSNPAVSQAITSIIKEKKPSFTIMGGDLCNDKFYTTWKEEFFTPRTNELIANIPFFHVSGNHESWNENTKAFMEYPSIGDKNGYYSYDCGDLHVLVLSTEKPLKEGSEQYKFAENDIKKSNKKWKVVVSHKPPLCYGGLHKNEIDLANLTDKVFAKNGVSLMISGHLHYYQHNTISSIEQFIIASSGGFKVHPIKGEKTVKCCDGYSFGIFNVSAKSLKVTIYNDKAEILDTVEIK